MPSPIWRERQRANGLWPRGGAKQGFDQIFVDYLHDRKFPIIGPACRWGLRVATLGVLVGVYEFNTNDVGLTERTSLLWFLAPLPLLDHLPLSFSWSTVVIRMWKA